MRSPSFEEHLLLPKGRDIDSEGNRGEHEVSSWAAPVWLVALVGILIVLEAIVYIRIGHLLLKDGSSLAELPFRSPYIGLDALYNFTNERPSKFEPLVNTPILATQISRAEPDKVFPVDTHQWLSDYGTLSPPDRNLHVTNTLHTILQFHILDWGMEKCALAVRLPTRDAILPHEHELNDIRGTIRLEICELDTVRPLNPSQLTWKKHPKCIKRLGIIDARVGEQVQLEPIPCQTGTFRAFEISCAPDMPNCGVNVWSNHNDTWGIFLIQYQTV